MDAPTEIEESREIAPSRGFGALADPARLVILCELQRGPACGCDLAPMLAMAPNLLSYHLRILKEAGLVEGTRQGRRTEYRVRPKKLEELTVELVRLAAGTHESDLEHIDRTTSEPRGTRSREPVKMGAPREEQPT
jgi:ArsR family transcriptional regulator, arsenate/arsenite/antimonite-responsive transcriptional repressor